MQEKIKDNEIKIDIKDGKVTVSFKYKNLHITDLIQVLSTVILNAMKSLVKAAPIGKQMELRNDLYDMYNMAASQTLRYFAPDLELHPGLTEQAIMEAENNIVNREYARVQVDPKYVSPIAEKTKIVLPH
jgi:spore germination protein GerM